MVSVRYIDTKGKITESKKPIQKKKYESKYQFAYTDYGLYFILPILGGIFLGQYLDRKFGYEPYCTLAGIILGGLFAFYNLFSLLKKPNG